MSTDNKEVKASRLERQGGSLATQSRTVLSSKLLRNVVVDLTSLVSSRIHVSQQAAHVHPDLPQRRILFDQVDLA